VLAGKRNAGWTENLLLNQKGSRRLALAMNTSLTAAFPAKLTPTVSRLAQLLDPSSGLPTSEPFAVSCDGETLQIPVRIYRPVISDAAFASLPPIEQSIAACWFTRHHDGHVRERFLRALPVFDCSWVIAYVVALCGEYVVEVVSYIWEHRSLFDRAVLGRWLRENQIFYSRTRSRIVSYWNCYYRSSSPSFETYVGSQLIAFFEESLTIQHHETGVG